MRLSQDIGRVLRTSRLFLGALFILVLPGIYLASGLYSVGPEQRGILYRFGAIVDDKVLPGMHYRLPWPIERIERLQTTAVRSMELDLAEGAGDRLQGELTTADLSLVDVALVLQYTIEGPGDFLVTAAEPEALLRQLAQAEAIQYLAGERIDSLLTTGRNQLQSSLRHALQAQSRALGLGVNVTSVQIKRLGPAAPVKRAFDDVAAARAQKQKLIEVERGERSSSLARARGDSNQVLQRAQAYASERLEQARGDREHFMTTWKEYRRSPDIMAHRLYVEALEAIFSRARLVVASPSNPQSSPPEVPEPRVVPPGVGGFRPVYPPWTPPRESAVPW